MQIVVSETAVRAVGGNPVKHATEGHANASRLLEACLNAEPSTTSQAEVCASERVLLRRAEAELEAARMGAAERKRETQASRNGQLAAIRADYPKCRGNDR